MKKEIQPKYSQIEQNFETIRFGIKEYTIGKDIDKCCMITMHKPHANHTQHALLTNHDTVYLFDNKFGITKPEFTKQSLLSDLCETKVNLRLQYKIPPILHLKMKYSYNFECVFLLLANSQIAVLTEEFYLIGYIDVVCHDPQNRIKYCLDYEYFEKQAFREVRKIKNGFFAFLFSENLELHEVQISTNHKLSKFKPSYKVSMIQLTKQIVDSSIKHPSNLVLFPFFRSSQFTKATEKLNNSMFLSINCLKEAIFYLINKQTMMIQKTIKIGKTQLNGAFIIDVQVSATNKRILVGLNNGSLKAISFKEETFEEIQYSVKISQHPLIKIYLQTTQKLLSVSKDSTLSIINLHTLTIEQRFKLGVNSQFFFVNSHFFVSVGTKSSSIYNSSDIEFKEDQFSKMLILSEFNCNYSKILQYSSEIVDYLLEDNSQVLQLSDNSLLINKHHKEKVQVIQTYLPPRSVSVKCIKQYPFSSMEEYWILTEKSEVYKYNVSESSQVTVSEVIELYRFIDKNQTQHRYSVSYFSFLTKIVPIEYDSQTTEKQYVKNEKSVEQLKPICLGTNTGQIIIVSCCDVFKIICRIKSFSTSITNILEVHPFSTEQCSSGLIIYQSKRSQKAIIAQFNPSKHPTEHFRINTAVISFKKLTCELFSIINHGTFCIYYSKYDQKSCMIYRQQHYNPGLPENSKISTLSLCSFEEKQYVIAGYSIGQILVYRLHRNINKKTKIYLHLVYYVESSKEQPIQFVRFHLKQLLFNFGQFIVSYDLPEEKEYLPLNSVDQNHHIEKGKGNNQFNFIEKSKKIKQKETFSIEKINQAYLPKLTDQKKRSKRSSSVATFNPDKNISFKAEFMFHFPDIQLYRSLINKSMIK